MIVRDIMSQGVICCSPTTNVGAAVELMWDHNCGILPVVGADCKLQGVATDRDICVAMGTRNRLPGELTIGEIATNNVFTCAPDDEIHQALLTIAEQHVRRLPVVDQRGIPLGILSLDDILTHADENKWEGCCELSSEEIVQTFKRLRGEHSRLACVKSCAEQPARETAYSSAATDSPTQRSG
jgi:CBS domain-containing protein